MQTSRVDAYGSGLVDRIAAQRIGQRRMLRAAMGRPAAQVGALAEAGFFGRKVAASGGKVGVGILCIRGAGGGRPGSMQEEAGRRRLAAEECLSSHRFREDVSLCGTFVVCENEGV